MIVRSAFAILTTMLLTGAALAAPVLRSDVVVSAAVVTVGESPE